MFLLLFLLFFMVFDGFEAMQPDLTSLNGAISACARSRRWQAGFGEPEKDLKQLIFLLILQILHGFLHF